MNVPTGYTVLDFVGFTDKGRYDATATYVKNDIVYFGGSSWKCKVDDTTGIEPAEGDNWTVFAEGESGSIVNDNTPYVSRTARDGLVKIPQLVGGTVAWNQLAGSSLKRNLGIFTWQTNNTVKAIGTASTTDRLWLDKIDPILGHKYLFVYDSETITGYIVLPSSIVEGKNIIFSATSTDKIEYGAKQVAETAYNDTISFVVADLTQMFGTAIADYVYSLEQATEGSGIAWLKSYGFFTKDYYAYDAGSLQSVCTSGRKITALDETIRNYPIENVELRGLFKLDANNKLYADGDIYPPSGSGRRKYGIVDLGTLNWYYDSPRMYSAVVSGLKPCPNNLMANILCVKYKTYRVIGQASGDDKTIGVSNDSRFYAYDTSYTDAATFKTAMSGVYAVYELATETTFSADPYINPQRSEGTEEFVDGLTRDVMIPVGNNSQYTVSSLIPIICEYIDAVANASVTPTASETEEVRTE